MSITITKGKLIRWIITAVILFCGAVEADDTPKVILSVVRHREFMADFSGYEDYSLLDVYEWRSGMFGVVMLCPVGFQETFVFDCRDGKKEIIYRDMYVPRKEKREELRRESILVADAVRLAKSALEHNIEQTDISGGEVKLWTISRLQRQSLTRAAALYPCAEARRIGAYIPG